MDIFNDKKELLVQRYKNHYLQQTFRLAWGDMANQVHDWNIDYQVLKDLLVGYSY